MEPPQTNLNPSFPNEKCSDTMISEEKRLIISMLDSSPASKSSIMPKCGTLEMVESAVEVKEDIPLIKRRWVTVAAGCCVATVSILALILGLLALTLAFTVFKRHDPIITVTKVQLKSIKVDNLNLTQLADVIAAGQLDLSNPTASLANLMAAGSPLNLSDVTMHVRVDVEVLVYNPNRASFRYTHGMSYLYYRGVEVGQAAVHPGRIGARGFEALNTTMSLNVTASSLLNNPNIVPDVSAGNFPMYATAHVAGHINFLNIFKHHARTSTLCTMSVSIALRTFENLTCSYKVRL